MPTDPFTRVGLYFWLGYDRANALVPGLQRIAQAGFNSFVRIRLTPLLRYAPDEPRFPALMKEYNFDDAWQAEVPAGVPFLPNAVRSSHFKEAFALPSFKTFLLAAYGSATHGDYGEFPDNHRKLTFVEAHADAIRAEYRDMTIALCDMYKGTGKHFIVANWETDSELFWAWWMHSPPVRPPTLEADIDGLKRWFELRQEAIRSGMAIAASNGWTDVKVSDGIEFSNFTMLQRYFDDADLPDTLRSIVLAVKPEYASYSAWDSSGPGDASRHPTRATYIPRFSEDLSSIKNLLFQQTGGTTTLIIGELGVPQRDLNEVQWRITHNRQPEPPERPTWHSRAWWTSQLALAALRADIPFITLWKAWDAPMEQSQLPADITDGELAALGRNWQGEGLLRADDFQDTETLRLIRANLTDRIDIFGINDLLKYGTTLTPLGSRDFEIYGIFPDASLHTIFEAERFFNYEVLVTVDGERRHGEIIGEFAGQINIRVSFVWTGDGAEKKTRWMTFQLRRRSDGVTSPAHGPVPFQYWQP